MFVGILLRNFARDFGVEFKCSHNHDTIKMSSQAVKKL